MKIGFLFPGQGAQSVGMCKDLYDTYEEVRKVYERASDILGFDVARLTFESTEEELGKTQNTQIAILVMSLAILELLKKERISAKEVAGLSLGEYTALIYAGFISFEEGIKLVQKRGEFMQNYVPEGEWSMAAVMGLDDEQVEEACRKAQSRGFVVPANYNCPKQVAISGEKDAVNYAMELAKEGGARKVRELKTGGPFHTEKLQEAANKLKEELEKVDINYNKGISLIKNIDAEPYNESTDIKANLAKHITCPVRFKESVHTMIEDGVDTFIEIGPGKVLSGFVKKIDDSVKIMHINNVESLKQTMESLKSDQSD